MKSTNTIFSAHHCGQRQLKIGLQGDVSDPRTNSFIYILDILPRLQRLPKYILLENVKGFETSSARVILVETLEKCGFKYQEFLLSPTCLGIPNSRLRYFLIAKLQSEPFSFHAADQILENFPDQEPKASAKHTIAAGLEKENCFTLPKEENIDPNSGGNGQCLQKEVIIFKLETANEMERKQNQDRDLSIQMLKDFLEEGGEELSQYFLPPKALLRYALLLDIVTPTCRRSTCFTKGYGHYVEGTGSVLQTAEDVQLESVFKSIEMLSEEEKLKKLSTLKLRYFTPREIANLHGFPPEFGFPDTITVKQRYRLLGNSLNVHVVAKLITLLTG
ncbi:tRNA (cytosine(38)-C(5))-methyltransferase isoform X3 [Carettochelys insculpta]|uniref:tRNA (cytosine(38)-C(5))-methyltransferase isoform X3 n=1 Tax=Carettochelys insculpta TaxID=44489 RepID=UPI003EBE1803